MEYTIRELNDINSPDDGIAISANSLTAAKRAASRKQMFQCTILVIEGEHGDQLSVKYGGSPWEDSAQ